jgi:branched-chain amino acid transport system permease protein
MAAHIRNGLRAGLSFGVVLIVIVYIGFTNTGAEVISGLFKTDLNTSLMIFLGLFGIWAGASGAKATEEDAWLGALLAGLAAGVLAGILVAIGLYIPGVITAAGVEMRTYLPQMSPEAVALLLQGKAPLPGALFNFGLIALTGLVGGLVARGIFRGGWRYAIGDGLKTTRKKIADTPAVSSFLASPVPRIGLIVLGVAALLVFPFYTSQYWNFILGTVGIYVLMGLGLNIVVGMAGLLDLGYVAFFAVGAYTVGLLTAPEPHGIMLNFWAALPVGIILAALAGILPGIPVLRLRGDYLAIVTLGFGEIIRVLAKSDMLASFAGGPQGVRDIGGPILFGIEFGSREYMYLIILGILLAIFVTIRLQDSRVGRAWVAMREDETVAQAMGINTWSHKLLAFAIGAAFAGLGGVLFAARNQYTGPEDHNLLVSINVLSLIIVGGMGSIPGVIVGAFALKGLPEILRELEDYRILAFGMLLVVMMIWRPEGLWPSRRRRMEMHIEEVAEEDQPDNVKPPGAESEGEGLL